MRAHGARAQVGSRAWALAPRALGALSGGCEGRPSMPRGPRGCAHVVRDRSWTFAAWAHSALIRALIARPSSGLSWRCMKSRSAGRAAAPLRRPDAQNHRPAPRVACERSPGTGWRARALALTHTDSSSHSHRRFARRIREMGLSRARTWCPRGGATCTGRALASLALCPRSALCARALVCGALKRPRAPASPP